MNFMLLKWIAINTSWEVKKLESSLWIHSLVWQLCVAHGLLGPADAGWNETVSVLMKLIVQWWEMDSECGGKLFAGVNKVM